MKPRSCWALLRAPTCRWWTRWPASPTRVLGFLRDLAAKAKPVAERELKALGEFAASHLGIARPAALGHRLLQRETARAALRFFRRGHQALLPAAAGHGRAVRHHRAGVRRAPGRAPRGGYLASGRAVLRRARPGRQRARRRLPGSLHAQRQARRRVDGRMPGALAGRAIAAQADRLPDLQLPPGTCRSPAAADADGQAGLRCSPTATC